MKLTNTQVEVLKRLATGPQQTGHASMYVNGTTFYALKRRGLARHVSGDISHVEITAAGRAALLELKK